MRDFIISSPDKSGSATFSRCKKYRYCLYRNLSHASLFDRDVRWLNMVMLNPSTADHVANDPTVARQCRRALRLGCTGLIVTNIFAFRATDPANMKKAENPIGCHNDYYIMREAEVAASSGGLVIVAWGAHGKHLHRSAAVIRELRARVPLYYLRLTKSGEPAHPLYIGYDVVPQVLI